MKTKIRTGPGTMLHIHDWLAEPRDGASADHARPGNAQPAGPGYAVPASYSCTVPASPGHAEPASYARAMSVGPGYAVPASYGCAEPADGSAQPQALAEPVTPAAPAARTAAPAAPTGPAGAPVRAVIGDQLRMPVMWCEMGSCISFHADPAALGEADTRARAIGAGWRIDALGRLACPRCQQADPGFRASSQVVPWDRRTAVARTARASRAAVRSSRAPGRALSGHPPASRAEPERDLDLGAARATPGSPGGESTRPPSPAGPPAARTGASSATAAAATAAY